jgi:hypothetical protein
LLSLLFLQRFQDTGQSLVAIPMSKPFRRVSSFGELLQPKTEDDAAGHTLPQSANAPVTCPPARPETQAQVVDDGIIRRGFVPADPAVEQLIEARQIRGLVHFTPMRNVPSIFEHGLVPRAKLEQRRAQGQLQFDYSDHHRFDGKESNCLSIAFPNGEMFFRKRQERPEWRWVVLVFHPEEILNHTATTFTVSNASRGGVERVSGAEGLQRVFGDSPAHWRCPPDRQAEVRSPRVLGVDLIKVICCHTEDDVKEVRRCATNACLAPSTNGAWRARVEVATSYFGNPRPPKYQDFPHS